MNPTETASKPEQREEFKFTRDQLESLLTSTTDIYRDYREAGAHPQEARTLATGDVLEGLDAEAALAERNPIMQTMPSSLEKAAPDMRDALDGLLSHPLAQVNLKDNPVLEADPFVSEWSNAIEAGKAALDKANGIEPTPELSQDRQQQREMELSR